MSSTLFEIFVDPLHILDIESLLREYNLDVIKYNTINNSILVNSEYKDKSFMDLIKKILYHNMRYSGILVFKKNL